MENSDKRPISKVNPIQTSLEKNLYNTSVVLTNNIVATSVVDSSVLNNWNYILDKKNGQLNSNVMNINFPNNSLIQNINQNATVTLASGNSNMVQSAGKPILQLADNRFIQIAQTPMAPTQQQFGPTILFSMPYRYVDNYNNQNQNLLSKKLLIKPQETAGTQNCNKLVTSTASTNNLFTGNSNLIINNSNVIFNNTIATSDTSSKTTLQQTDSPSPLNLLNQNQIALLNNGSNNIIPLDKYQEISDMLYNKKLLLKTSTTEETVLVEFRLSNHKFQYRMTRMQKSEMEKLLTTVGDQQKQLEILQVYQAEQRKQMQQRPSVVLNQMINSKGSPNIICNPSQIPGLATVGKSMYPINSVLVAVPPNHQLNDNCNNLVQPVNGNNSNPSQTNNNLAFTTNAGNSTPNGLLINYSNTRQSTPQSSIMSSNIMRKELTRDSIIRSQQKRPLPRSALSVNSNSTSIQTSACSSVGTATTSNVNNNNSNSNKNFSTQNTFTANTAAIASTSSVSSLSLSTVPNANVNNDMKPARLRRYNNMRKIIFEDHNSVLKPDYSTPFADLSDAARRLLPYHVLEESKDQNHIEVDKILERSFQHLEQKSANFRKLTHAVLLDDMMLQENDGLLIKRMRLDLERDVLDREKLSQTNCFGNKSFVPLLFDENGNAYPSKIDCEESLDATADNINSIPAPETVSIAAMVDVRDNLNSQNESDILYDYEMILRDVIIDDVSVDDDFKDDDDLDQKPTDDRRGQQLLLNDSFQYNKEAAVVNDVKVEKVSYEDDNLSEQASSDHTIPVIDEDQDIHPTIPKEEQIIRHMDEDSISSSLNKEKTTADCINDTGLSYFSSDTTDNLYNIQDISGDSFDPNKLFDSTAEWNQSNTDVNLTDDILVNQADNQQSEDPDVDAAIRSILF